MEIAVIFEWFYLYEVVSKYAKDILACTENTLKAYKRTRRKRQEHFIVNGEYADKHKTKLFSANFRPKPYIFQILNQIIEREKDRLTLSSILSL